MESVDYALNRLDEAQQIADEREANSDSDVEAIESYYDGQLNDLSNQVEASSDDLDAAQEELDNMQAYMDELVEAQNEAEQAEAESREKVADYEADVMSLSDDLKQAKKMKSILKFMSKKAKIG